MVDVASVPIVARRAFGAHATMQLEVAPIGRRPPSQGVGPPATWALGAFPFGPKLIFGIKSLSGKFGLMARYLQQVAEHDTDHGKTEECSNGRCVAFEVASQATVTTDPRERSFDDPPFG